MASSLDDILTATKNIVTALNNATQTYLTVSGAQNYTRISSTAVASVKAGRLVVVSITTAGSSVGTIYDANTVGVTTSPLYIIPNAVGIVQVNLPVSYGIVVVPGTGQVVTISYS